MSIKVCLPITDKVRLHILSLGDTFVLDTVVYIVTNMPVSSSADTCIAAVDIQSGVCSSIIPDALVKSVDIEAKII